MDQVIQSNKNELNLKCYFYNPQLLQQGKLKLWNNKYYDYILRKDFETIQEWMDMHEYDIMDVHWGSPKLQIPSILLTDLIKHFDPEFEFETEDDESEDSGMGEMQEDMTKWCLCCKRTCPKCSEKND